MADLTINNFTISPSSGSNDQILSVSTPANKTRANRTVTIKATGTNSSDTLTLTQEFTPLAVTLLNPSTDISITDSGTANTINISATANGAYMKYILNSNFTADLTITTNAGTQALAANTALLINGNEGGTYVYTITGTITVPTGILPDTYTNAIVLQTSDTSDFVIKEQVAINITTESTLYFTTLNAYTATIPAAETTITLTGTSNDTQLWRPNIGSSDLILNSYWGPVIIGNTTYYWALDSTSGMRYVNTGHNLTNFTFSVTVKIPANTSTSSRVLHLPRNIDTASTISGPNSTGNGIDITQSGSVAPYLTLNNYAETVPAAGGGFYVTGSGNVSKIYWPYLNGTQSCSLFDLALTAGSTQANLPVGSWVTEGNDKYADFSSAIPNGTAYTFVLSLKASANTATTTKNLLVALDTESTDVTQINITQAAAAEAYLTLNPIAETIPAAGKLVQITGSSNLSTLYFDAQYFEEADTINVTYTQNGASTTQTVWIDGEYPSDNSPYTGDYTFSFYVFVPVNNTTSQVTHTLYMYKETEYGDSVTVTLTQAGNVTAYAITATTSNPWKGSGIVSGSTTCNKLTCTSANVPDYISVNDIHYTPVIVENSDLTTYTFDLSANITDKVSYDYMMYFSTNLTTATGESISTNGTALTNTTTTYNVNSYAKSITITKAVYSLEENGCAITYTNTTSNTLYINGPITVEIGNASDNDWMSFKPYTGSTYFELPPANTATIIDVLPNGSSIDSSEAGSTVTGILSNLSYGTVCNSTGTELAYYAELSSDATGQMDNSTS